MILSKMRFSSSMLSIDQPIAITTAISPFDHNDLDCDIVGITNNVNKNDTVRKVMVRQKDGFNMFENKDSNSKDIGIDFYEDVNLFASDEDISLFASDEEDMSDAKESDDEKKKGKDVIPLKPRKTTRLRAASALTKSVSASLERKVLKRPVLRRQVSFADSVPGNNLTALKEFDFRDPPNFCSSYDKLVRSMSNPDIPYDKLRSIPTATFSFTRCPLAIIDSNHNVVNLVHIRYDYHKQHMFGSISVQNLAYEKLIWIRYTSDGWNTFNDAYASYSWTRVGYHGPSNDYFSFTFDIDHELLIPGIQVEFAVGCKMGGETYWDNNHGLNYAAEVDTYQHALPTA